MKKLLTLILAMGLYVSSYGWSITVNWAMGLTPCNVDIVNASTPSSYLSFGGSSSAQPAPISWGTNGIGVNFTIVNGQTNSGFLLPDCSLGTMNFPNAFSLLDCNGVSRSIDVSINGLTCDVTFYIH